MEHWFAAVAASIIGIVGVALVVLVSLRVAGPEPAYTFVNHPAVTSIAVH
jgi:hypothetical protein